MSLELLELHLSVQESLLAILSLIYFYHQNLCFNDGRFDCFQAQNFVFRFRGFANTHKQHFLKASFQNCCFVRAVFAFRKSSLKEIFKGYCCLLFNYQGSFCCSFQATAFIFYQKLFSLSRTFLTFFKVFHFLLPVMFSGKAEVDVPDAECEVHTLYEVQ